MERWRRYFGLAVCLAAGVLVWGCGVSSIGVVDLSNEEIKADTPELQAVQKFNADFFGGRVVRWGDDVETVEVYDSVGISSLRTIVDEINEARIGPQLVIGDSDFMVRIYEDDSIYCGDKTVIESWNYWNNHEIASVNVGINTQLWWCSQKLVVKHALIHSLGFWGHTEDWGVMHGVDANDTDWLEKWTGEITDPVILTMRELYRIPPGTKIN